MKVIKIPNRSKPNMAEDGIYVILPMMDPTYLDCIIRWKASTETIIWKFELSADSGNPHRNPYGNHFISANGKNLYPDTKDFLSIVADHHPENLEFFIWHPEVFEGKYYE